MALADIQSASRYFAVVPAAGVGRRMGAECPKQYLSVLEKTVIEHTLQTLLNEPLLDAVVVVISADDKHWRKLPVFSDSRIEVVEGGAERSDSVLNGLLHLSQRSGEKDWVLVHDVARPCVANKDIRKLMTALVADPVGGILAVPVSDTIKQADPAGICATVDRSTLWHAQTPQMFPCLLLIKALSQAQEQGHVVTDEASAIELMGLKPQLVEGSRTNIKITRPEDLALAEFYLKKEISPCE